jgi:hypothetical protein
MCGDTKPHDEFYRQQGGKYLSSWCKDCTKLRMRVLREAAGVPARPRPPRDDEGKTCPRCKTHKPFAAFTRPSDGQEGTYCRPCAKAKWTEERRRHEERRLAEQRERYARSVDPTEIRRCPRCGEDKPRSEFSANGKGGYCKPCRADYAREANQRKRDQRREEQYGYTSDDFDALRAKQGGGCAICGRTRVTNGRWTSEHADDLHVDHDHVTGDVRGLLCNKCNVGLGLFEDSPESLLRAIEYLKNPPALS